MVVEAEVHENRDSEIESDSEISNIEASDVDLALNQEIEDSQKANPHSYHPFFLYTNQTRHCNWQLTHWIVILSRWIKTMILF